MKKVYSGLTILALSAVMAGCYTPAGRGGVVGATTGATISYAAGGSARTGAYVGGAMGATTGVMRANRYRRHYRW